MAAARPTKVGHRVHELSGPLAEADHAHFAKQISFNAAQRIPYAHKPPFHQPQPGSHPGKGCQRKGIVFRSHPHIGAPVHPLGFATFRVCYAISLSKLPTICIGLLMEKSFRQTVLPSLRCNLGV